jgi:hypothetical protein
VVVAAVLALAMLTLGFLAALGVRSLVTGTASASPAAPNPGHEWSQVEGHGIDGSSYWLGTTADQALELRVNGQRALRLEPNGTETPNVIGGYSGNWVTSGVEAATIGGGGSDPLKPGPAVPNRVTDLAGSVGGGVNNQAGSDDGDTVDGWAATVGGGAGNTASGESSTVGGGVDNTASASSATIGGGTLNQASGDYFPTVSGGRQNTASGHSTTVGGGHLNTASYDHATVAGGYQNTAGAWGATIGGGHLNQVTGDRSTVGGGENNTASGNAATVGGGLSNTASDEKATVSGGTGNQASSWGAAIGGGDSNVATAPLGTVGGGRDNTASGVQATVGGGVENVASAEGTTVCGGSSNRVTDEFGTVGGGYNNQAGDNGGTPSDRPSAAVGGGNSNTASGEVSFVGGGYSNTASGATASVAGGNTNTASGNHATVAGGNTNIASGSGATVGGGGDNTASEGNATVSGGGANTASAVDATVAGGWSNTASGHAATVAGGNYNTATGDYSLAAGRRAKANHTGSFVWADNDADVDFASTANNEFSARTTGGVRFVSAIDGSGNPTAGVTLAAGGGSWSSISDLNAKANFSSVDGQDVLASLAEVPITTWNYKAQDASIRHMGPMAQDFYAAFGLGESDTSITTVDADGVALAAIQGLYELLQETRAENAALEARIGQLEGRAPTTEGAAAAAGSPGLPLTWPLLGGGVVMVVVGVVLARWRLKACRP